MLRQYFADKNFFRWPRAFVCLSADGFQTLRTLTFSYSGVSYPGVTNHGPNLDPNASSNPKL